MADLKTAVENCGFTEVSTFIQSGNVIFMSDEKNTERIIEKLESMVLKTFKVNSRIVVRSHTQMKKVVEEVPSEWEKGNNLRCYIAFIKEPITANDVLKEITLKEGVDSVKIGERVLYMSTKLSGLTKSSFTKLASKKIYQDMTIRNYNTTKKLLTLMEA